MRTSTRGSYWSRCSASSGRCHAYASIGAKPKRLISGRAVERREAHFVDHRARRLQMLERRVDRARRRWSRRRPSRSWSARRGARLRAAALAGMRGSRPASMRSTSAQHATDTPIGPNESSVRGKRHAALLRNAARGRLEAGEAAQRRRDADRAAGVGAERDGRHAVGDRRRRARRRTARDPLVALHVARDRATAACRSAGSGRARRTRIRSCWCARRSRRPPVAGGRPRRASALAGGASASTREPARVTWPSISKRSLTDTGMPASGESTVPARAQTRRGRRRRRGRWRHRRAGRRPSPGPMDPRCARARLDERAAGGAAVAARSAASWASGAN